MNINLFSSTSIEPVDREICGPCPKNEKQKNCDKILHKTGSWESQLLNPNILFKLLTNYKQSRYTIEFRHR